MQQVDSNNKYICKNENWLQTKNDRLGILMLSPAFSSTSRSCTFIITGDGKVFDSLASNANSVFPSVYLNTVVKITSGSGTSSDPYFLN